MEGIYVFLLRWDIPILFIATLSLIVGLVKLFQARSILRRAMFSLERDYGRETRQNGSALTLFAVVSIGVLWYVNQIVAPTLPQELLFLPTPTIDPLKTPLASPSPESPVTEVITRIDRETVLGELVATATLDPNIFGNTPVADELLELNIEIETPTRPAEIFIPDGGGCTPAVNISSPRPESTQGGQIRFVGSASDPDFAFFELQLNGPGTGNEWTNLIPPESLEVSGNSTLGTADLSQLTNGPYRLRLSVYGSDTQPIRRCEISIFIGSVEQPSEEPTEQPDEQPAVQPTEQATEPES